MRADEIRNQGDAGTIDWDPICDCQDDDGLRLLRVNILKLRGDRATVQAVLGFPEPATKTVGLSLEDGEGMEGG
jgi:hypothetical protein